MSCNKYKNPHYKSSTQFYNNTAQAVATTNISTNPLVLSLGTIVTDTGCSIDENTNSLTINNSGLYRIFGSANITGTVDGVITVGMTINGVVLPETLKAESVTVGESIVVPFETIRNIQTCCNVNTSSIGFIAYSDSTATGTIKVSGNAVKLA